jgi:hypothetical protein
MVSATCFLTRRILTVDGGIIGMARADTGEPVTDDDLRDLGIDPETVSGNVTEPDAPSFSE